MAAPLPPAEALRLVDLIGPAERGIASRVLSKTGGGNVTLFAFDAGEGLSEHTAPFDALVLVLEGSLTLTVGGTTVTAPPGTIVRLPANVPHAVDATLPSKMLLVMLREPKADS
jgi:quercetin dioxygenase-like cupin family protein